VQTLLQAYDQKLAEARAQIAQLERELFGPKSERLTREQQEQMHQLLQDVEAEGQRPGAESAEVLESKEAEKRPPQRRRGVRHPLPAHLKIEGKAKMMRIYIGEADRWKDKPLYNALVEAMRANDIAGVTVYRGILGYGAHRRIHKDKALHLSHDSSIMLSVIDTEEKLESFLPLVGQMVEEGLVVMSDADIIKYSYRPLDAEQNAPQAGSGTIQG